MELQLAFLLVFGTDPQGDYNMRARLKAILRRAENWRRSGLPSTWRKVTNPGFLTLMIAAGTLATAFVAYQNGRRTQEQVQLLKQQVGLNSAETRPFFRLKASVSLTKPYRVVLKIIDAGPIPGRVIGYDMFVQVGREVVEPKGGILNTGDILYPDQPGLGVYLPLSKTEFKEFEERSEPLVAGGCVVYAPTTLDNTRRWTVSAAYHFDSWNNVPIGLFAREVPVSAQTDSCDAASLRNEWASQLKIYPK